MIGLTVARVCVLATFGTLLLAAFQPWPSLAAISLPDRSAAPQTPTSPSPVIVTIDPATAWQPRGGIVLVDITPSDPTSLSGLVLRACLSWRGAKKPPTLYPAAIDPLPSKHAGSMTIGVEVPDMELSDGWWPGRILSVGNDVAAFGTVPLANLRIIGASQSAIVFDTVGKVGITSLWNAFLTTLGSVILALGILHELARRRGVVAAVQAIGRRLPGQTLILRLITTTDGHASLSQLQILLWTFVVGASSVYVMCLSGDLIDVTNGTVALLGIAGAAGLVAAHTQASDPSAPVGQPSWTDLIAPDDGSPGTDIKRVQMLYFTVISASFVLLKVLTCYAIPEIPSGYLLLMGISNGVYVGGKLT